MIAWCDEIGWDIFETLSWIMLAGNAGMSVRTVNLLTGRSSEQFLLRMQTLGLVKRYKSKTNGEFRFKSIIRRAPLPPSANITEEGTLDARKTMMDIAEERARDLLKIGIPGRGDAIKKDAVILPTPEQASSYARARARARAERKKDKETLSDLPNLFKGVKKLKKKRKIKKIFPKINPDSVRSSYEDLWNSPDRIPHDSPRNTMNEPAIPRKPVVTYVNEPSTHPRLSGWRMKENLISWSKLDWVGYWLTKWKEFYGQEDPTFVGHALSRSIKYAKNKKGYIDDPYWELGIKIISFRDSGRGFRCDSRGLKEYIDWLFSEFLKEAEWLKTPLMASQAFRVMHNTFLDRFKVREIKIRTGKDMKGKGKWRPWGYED